MEKKLVREKTVIFPPTRHCPEEETVHYLLYEYPGEVVTGMYKKEATTRTAMLYEVIEHGTLEIEGYGPCAPAVYGPMTMPTLEMTFEELMA